jgi:hypothetical protein
VRRPGLLLALGLTLAALSQAPAAMAVGEPAFGCGHVHTGTAERNPYPSGPPPVAIGDSTMLLPIPDLTRVGYDVNAKGCRGFKQSVWVARDLLRQGKLGPVVAINAYGNGGVNPHLIRFALNVLGPKRTLVLVTAYDADTGHPPAPDTDVLVKAAKQYPDRIKLLDWVAYSLPHHKTDPEPGAWFLPDLFHPNFTGAPIYADFLARALPGGPPSASDEDSGGGVPWWAFAIGGTILLLAGGVLVRRLRH